MDIYIVLLHAMKILAWLAMLVSCFVFAEALRIRWRKK